MCVYVYVYIYIYIYIYIMHTLYIYIYIYYGMKTAGMLAVDSSDSALHCCSATVWYSAWHGVRRSLE